MIQGRQWDFIISSKISWMVPKIIFEGYFNLKLDPRGDAGWVHNNQNALEITKRWLRPTCEFGK